MGVNKIFIWDKVKFKSGLVLDNDIDINLTYSVEDFKNDDMQYLVLAELPYLFFKESCFELDDKYYRRLKLLKIKKRIHGFV